MNNKWLALYIPYGSYIEGKPYKYQTINADCVNDATLTAEKRRPKGYILLRLTEKE